MSLATRCTHCGTIFKVVQDQLKVSEGWVRCGRCHEVFNALPALFDLEKDPPPPRPAHLGGPAEDAPGQEAAPTSAPEQEAQRPVQTAEMAADTASDQAASVVATNAAEASPEEAAPAPTSAPPAAPAPSPTSAFAPTQSPSSSSAGSASNPMSRMPAEPSSTSAPPTPPAQQPHPLAGQGLIAEADVDLGFDSKPPSGWAQTQPADIPRHLLDEDDLALDPAPIEATTDFELDTSIAVDDNTPLEAVLASMAPRQAPTARAPAHVATPPAVPAQKPAQPPHRDGMASVQAQQVPEELSLRSIAPSPSPSPWLDEPPENVPSTEEEDALDSRYLMPSTSRERKTPRRMEEGPEFVDAQFPTDAFIDAEEDWASDFGPSALEADAALPPAAPSQTTASPSPAGTASITTDGLRAAPIQTANSDGSDNDDSAPPDSHLPMDDGGASGDQPTFMKHARRKAFWRHPATRAALGMLLLGLLSALALQLGHQFRDLIAAHHPASRPLLAHWCELADCEIKPPLRIEDLQVESATLVRAASEGPDSYRLAVVVHNRSAIGLAWPHIDLTLTDENGAVIARRVFSPGDAQWLDTADAKADTSNGQPEVAAIATPAAVPGQRSTTLQWRLLAPDIKPAGYTAELFYP